MEFNLYESNILKQLDNLGIDVIQEGIDELERNIDRIYFGSHFKEKLKILYILKEHAEYKIVCREIEELKEQLIKEWSRITDIRETRVKTFNTWVKYQNQLKGDAFVRDSLKHELEQLQFVEHIESLEASE